MTQTLTTQNIIRRCVVVSFPGINEQKNVDVKKCRHVQPKFSLWANLLLVDSGRRCKFTSEDRLDIESAQI